MAPKSTILVASFDPELANVRKHVLEAAGYRDLCQQHSGSSISLPVWTRQPRGYWLLVTPSEKRRVGQEIRELCGASTPILELHQGQGPVLADATATNGDLSQSSDELSTMFADCLRNSHQRNFRNHHYVESHPVAK